MCKEHNLGHFFDPKYLTDEVWELPKEADERKSKIWFDMAACERLQTPTEFLMYIGTFQNGCFHGQGFLFASSDSRPVLFGEFCHGLLHGNAAVFAGNRVVAKCRFHHGSLRRLRPYNESKVGDFRFRGAQESIANPATDICNQMQEQATKLYQYYGNSSDTPASQKIANPALDGVVQAASVGGRGHEQPLECRVRVLRRARALVCCPQHEDQRLHLVPSIARLSETPETCARSLAKSAGRLGRFSSTTPTWMT